MWPKYESFYGVSNCVGALIVFVHQCNGFPLCSIVFQILNKKWSFLYKKKLKIMITNRSRCPVSYITTAMFHIVQHFLFVHHHNLVWVLPFLHFTVKYIQPVKSSAVVTLPSLINLLCSSLFHKAVGFLNMYKILIILRCDWKIHS